MPTHGNIHVDKRLTAISIAYPQSEFIGLNIFPNVNVSKESDKYMTYGQENFNSEILDRSENAEYKKIDFSYSDTTYTVKEWGVEHVIPDDKAEDADPPIDLRMDATEMLTSRLMLTQEKRIADLAFSGSYITQTSALSGTNRWDDDNSDPVKLIASARGTIESSVGLTPNSLVIGYQVFEKLREHPDLLNRISYTQTQILNEELLKSIFRVKNIWVGAAKYNSSKEGQTASLSYVWGKSALLCYVPDRPGLRQMALGYNFLYTPRTVERYRDDSRRGEVIRVRHKGIEKLTTAAAGYLYTTVVS